MMRKERCDTSPSLRLIWTGDGVDIQALLKPVPRGKRNKTLVSSVEHGAGGRLDLSATCEQASLLLLADGGKNDRPRLPLRESAQDPKVEAAMLTQIVVQIIQPD